MNSKLFSCFLLVSCVQSAVPHRNKVTKVNSSLVKLDIRVSSIVPRHQCRRALRNLEVITFSFELQFMGEDLVNLLDLTKRTTFLVWNK